jgi:predicted anti-sigma-YlaC factor YlaD
MHPRGLLVKPGNGSVTGEAFMNRPLTALVLCMVLFPACSIKRIAVNKLGNALAAGGATFEGDDDPDLVGDSLPFALKLMESLLAESPRHTGLLLASARGFTEYSYAFVGQSAELAFRENVAESNVLRARSRRLYLRGRAYGLRALEIRYPGFNAALDRDCHAALARVRVKDLPLLYWTAAAQGLAIAASKDDPEMIAQLPMVEAFVQRAIELDETWNEGALPEFLISVEGARSGVSEEHRQAVLRRHFERALQLSAGKRASLFVSYAENSAVATQNRNQFRDLLSRALSIDADQYPATRLANLIAQRRARWLLECADELFLQSSVTNQ